jgi:AcrR family transcriptional regulator
MINSIFNLDTQTIDERTKVLVHAQSRYLKEGFYKISMDNLAFDLKMSKKTIYKYFPTKENLVEEVAHFTMNMVSERVDKIITSETDVIKKITNLIELFGGIISQFSEKWLSDLRIHMPAVWEMIDNFRAKKIYSFFSQIIEQGKEEDYFLDKPNEIVITIFVASLRAIVNPEFLSHNKFSYKEAMSISLEILFNGILTDKGKKLLKKSMNKDEQ